MASLTLRVGWVLQLQRTQLWASQLLMGRGDPGTWRGKIFKGSSGKVSSGPLRVMAYVLMSLAQDLLVSLVENY